MHKSNRPALIIALFSVVLLAFILRAYFLISVPQPSSLKGDAHYYRAMAVQLVDEGIYGYMSQEPNAYVTPGFPLFLSAAYLVSRDEQTMLTIVRWTQAFLGALTTLLVGSCAFKAGGRAAAVAAALLYAVYPPFIWSVGAILTEVLFTSAFVGFVLAYLLMAEPAWGGPSARRIGDAESVRASIAAPHPPERRGMLASAGLPALTGALLAAAVLVRPTVAPLLVVLFAAECIVNRTIPRVPVLLWCLLGFVVLMSPWWLRNILTLHEPIFFATQTGNPMLGGTDPYFLNPNVFAGIPRERQLEAAIHRIIEGFRTQPVLYLKWFTVGKLFYTFGEPYFGGTVTNDFLRGFKFIHWVLLTVGVPGFIIGSLLNPAILRMTIMAVTVIVIQLMFIPQYRYAYPVMALLCISTGWLASWAWRWLRQ